MGIVKNRTLSLVVLSLSFSGCATTDSDSNYAYRNNIDSARSRCVELARSSGFKEVAVDSVEREGQAEWKVGLVLNKDGKNRKETCEYNASTNRVRLG
jgi:outer membrane lipoprotein SlyB